MDKIQERVLEATIADTDVGQGKQEHIPPPTNSKNNPAKPSLYNMTATAEIAMLKPSGNDAVEAKMKTSSSTWAKSSNKLEYLFYKTLLTILYMIYACVRYAKYQYNRTKIQILNLAYSPSNTPQLIRQDVLKFQKLPKRLATILEFKSEGDVGGGLGGLINDGSELVTWSISVGIKHLTLYDYDGHLKKNVDEFRKGIHHKLSKYYGPSNVPKFAIRIPQWNKVYFNLPGTAPSDPDSKKVALEVSLLSNRDGRETIVDLTKTMADLCVNNEMKLSDITMKLVDSELTQLVGPEPDLLLYFGPSLDLQGFPPWHIRLTEFYWEEDNDQVTYSVFIRGLKSYSTCKINVGK